MHPQDQRLLNKRIIRTQVCKVCQGPLVEKHVDGQLVVLCGQDATHEGFISEAQATHLQKLQSIQAAEVRANYPQFAGPSRSAAQDTTDLWG